MDKQYFLIEEYYHLYNCLKNLHAFCFFEKSYLQKKMK